jgi:hypothetical protein
MEPKFKKWRQNISKTIWYQSFEQVCLEESLTPSDVTQILIVASLTSYFITIIIMHLAVIM